MEASVLAALLRAAIAVLGGYVVVWLKADVTWNFVAIALGNGPLRPIRIAGSD